MILAVVLGRSVVSPPSSTVRGGTSRWVGAGRPRGHNCDVRGRMTRVRVGSGWPSHDISKGRCCREPLATPLIVRDRMTGAEV
jgi:hypothetical protein